MIDSTVRATAAAFGDATLRTLDAIHLATALVVLGRDLTAFVTYDRRLSDAALRHELPTASPGTATGD